MSVSLDSAPSTAILDTSGRSSKAAPSRTKAESASRTDGPSSFSASSRSPLTTNARSKKASPSSTERFRVFAVGSGGSALTRSENLRGVFFAPWVYPASMTRGPGWTVLVAPLLLVGACGSDQDGGGGGGSGNVSGSGGSAATGGGGIDGAAGWATGGGGADADAGCTLASCGAPGHVCVGGACVEDCRLPGATACDTGKVCDVGSEHLGKCVVPGNGCVVSSPMQACGAAGTCGPGTLCDGQGGCYPAPPCANVQCEAGQCWGTGCSCQRPSPACAAAPLGKPGDAGTLNDPVFTKCGKLSSCDGGIVDLDFDQSCNAYGVTIISGADYLRKIEPSGTVSEVTGVTNLDMGEVATIKGKGGLFGGGLLDVALTYVCCPTCGCTLSGGQQQGVASLEGSALPIQIPSTTLTTGAGPFGAKVLDAGPAGLAWGLDRVLYVGNVDTNGDYRALDLGTKTGKTVATFTKRVHASAPFDKTRMVVVLEGGEVMLAPVLGATGSTQSLVTLSTHATSVVRDAWSGRVYAELADKSIVSFAPDGSGLTTFQTAPALGRITIAPDGYLYHLSAGFIGPPEIVRWQLPATL